MSEKGTSLAQYVEHFGLEILNHGDTYETDKVESTNVNRPDLQILGLFDYFDARRIQVMGKAELTYIMKMMEYLSKQLAPCITRHGVLLDIYGEGVMITGDSGVGKSESAIELIMRGHRLVADDAVEIRRVADQLIGTAPEVIRNYIELRGIGVIDVQQLFGMRAVMPESQIDLVVEFEPWDSSKAYDRLGIEDRFIDILGKQVPCVTLPIRPGRNLASIVEVAAMNNRHRRYGYNAAEELARKVDLHADLGSKSANQGK